MSPDEFTRLYTLISKRFDEIDKRLDSKADKADMGRVFGVLDDINKRLDISDDERLIIGYQLSRLQNWLSELVRV
jgi:hypothetical protein